MWMVNPHFMCNQHLLGEHGEIHLHRHNFVKQHSIRGRIEPVVQIEPMAMKVRHDRLAVEMTLRGMNHKSPYEMPDISYLPDEHRLATVCIPISVRDLSQRCQECRKLLNAHLSEQYNDPNLLR